ncbi:hypothetical protein DSL72_008308 [Monilinia vaccinii-corymbosi]|uniref:Ankyrin repeat protein n=1 Tax=Monilinia vaccinii-corymbosi TaxID=61207 RepID=A0A8A3PJG4_9HELO|nr:hypothetical protein DSL72_008308 [Monilinia vaccinii-corymbosi]
MADHLTAAPTADPQPTLVGDGDAPEEKNEEARPEAGGDGRNSDLPNSREDSEAREKSGSENYPNDQSKLNQALLDAAKNENEPEVIRLLELGADLSAVDWHGCMALFKVVEYGLMDAAHAIVSKYPKSVNFQIKHKNTPLHFAAFFKQHEMVEFLLSKGAKVDLRDAAGETALHAAILGNAVEIVKYLLEKNAKVDLQNIIGRTALHMASSSGNDIAVELLLEKNAKVDIRDTSGKTALQSAIHGRVVVSDPESDLVQSHRAIVRALSKEMDLSDRKHELMRIASIQKKEEVNFLLKNMDWADLGQGEFTEFERRIDVVWNACRGARHEAAREILKDVNSKDAAISDQERKDWTALEWAAYCGDHVVVWWLLVSGSRKEMDIDRKKALDLAERQKEKRKPEQKDYSLTIDILRDPPLVQGWSEPDEPYEHPQPYIDLKALLQRFEGTIVDFDRGEKSMRVDFLRRTRTVWDIIYGKPMASETDRSQDKFRTSGPTMIMEEARQNLKKIGLSSEVAKQESYSEEDLQLRWVHLPANNMEWMMDLPMRVYMDKRKAKEEYQPLREFMNHSWHELPGSSPELNCMSATCVKEKVSSDKEAGKQDQKHASDDSQKTSSEFDPKNNKSREYWRTALYMPYLTFSNYSKHGSELTTERKRFNDLIEAYEFHDRSASNDSRRILHSSRTLDQFYYHSLPDTSRRDSSQVVTRYAGFNTEDDETWDILRVDELWLWVVDEKTIITSSTSRLDHREDPVLEGVFDSLREAKGKNKGQPPPSSVDELCKYITSYCIELFDKATLRCIKRNNDRLSVRQIFSNSINDATNGEMELFTKFKRKIDDKVNPQGRHHNIPKEASAKPEDQEKDYKSISTATNLLLEVKDIRDELNILKYLLEQQKRVWERLLEMPADTDEASEGSDLPHRKETERWKGPDLTIRDILEMDKLTQRIQESVNSVLGLEQNEANLSEAVSARNQGKTLMVFTIITIVFLPMSFLASLFALNIKSFPHEGENLVYESGFIFSIIFGVTVSISIPTIIYAFFDKISGTFFDRISGPFGSIITVLCNSSAQHSSEYLSEGTADISNTDSNSQESAEGNDTARPERQSTRGQSEVNHLSTSSNINSPPMGDVIVEPSDRREKSFSMKLRRLRFCGTRNNTHDVESQEMNVRRV